MDQIVLVSQSPRRRALIQLLGYPVAVMAADVDEDSITLPDPAANVVQTAQLKAEKVLDILRAQLELQSSLVVAADTTVTLNGRFLNKPADADDARQMLRALRNRTHEVHTGLVLYHLPSGQSCHGVQTAVVTMRNYTDTEIDAYIATGDPMDKAGAYAIQHPQFQPVSYLEGCYMGVMGLSLCHLMQLMARLSLPVSANLASIAAAHAPYPVCGTFIQIKNNAKKV